MLESLVASILNRFLKNYVSNLNYDQLKIGMWKGEVNLKNLKLRRDALDKLDLPINVSEGYLGELTLVIPWSNLKNEPVKVIIDHVYLLAEPKSESTVTVEEEDARAQELKHRRLSTAEMLENPEAQAEQNSNSKGSEGFLSQLTTKVVDNLQFTIKNVHIRYEDHISDPGHPFSAGITLKELSALSTDDQWTPKFISEHSNTINKLATLESLSVYWNTDSRSLAGTPPEEASKVYTDLIPSSCNAPKEHQYILRPVSGIGRVKLNKNYGGDIPKTDVAMFFDELAFGLDDHQYRDAILMIDNFHINLKKQKYLKFHPEKGKKAKANPREYFQFAAKAILSEIHERNYKWTWDHFKKRRDQRLQYVECYTADRLKKATPEQVKSLKKLEHDLSFEDIRFYRSVAKSKLRREKVKIEKQNEKKKAESAKAGWWGWITGSAPATTEEESGTDDDTGSIHMTEEQKKELYDAIDYDEDKASIASAVDVPADTIKFAIKTKLNRGSFTLKQQVKKATETDLITVVFDAVSVDVTQYVESMKIAAALGDLQLFDGSTKDTIYHQLIGVKKSNSRNSSLLDMDYNVSEKERRKSTTLMADSASQSDPFFSIRFEKKPLSKVADNAFSLKMRHLEIIYSPVVIAGIMKFFKPPTSKMESVNALIAVAGDTFEGFKLQTRAGLEYALEAHTTFDLDVDMDAPIIIIPESLTSQDSSVMIIDAGHINIDSQLADKALINDIKNKDVQKYSKEDSDTLESLMYDKFNLQLSQTKVLIGTNTKECLWQLQDHPPRNGVDARFIERIDMNFLIELCILPGKTEFTKFKISGHLPLLSVNLSDSKYKILMRIVDFVVPKSDDEETEPTSAAAKRPQLKNTARSTSTSNVISDRFWGPQISGNYILPDDASESTVVTSTSATPTASIAPSATIANTDVEQFKLSFKVDKVSVNLHETSSTDATESLLCEILLQSFELMVLTRPLDLMVNISLKALTIIDKMENVGDFHNLITSDIIDRKENIGHSGDKNLVNVKFCKIQREHPQFQEYYDSYDQTVDVALSTLTVVVTRNSHLRIYNWIMNTFTAPPKHSAELSAGKEEFEGDIFYDDSSATPYGLQRLKTSVAKREFTKSNDPRMKVAIYIDSVDLILNKDGVRLGTGELSFGELNILLEPNTIEVNGKFGNFTLSDDTAISTNNDASTTSLSSSAASETYIVSIVGDELAAFTYKTFDPKSPNFPDYNQKFDLRMGAIQLFVTDSVKPTLDFLQEFLQMKNVYDAARNSAVETAQQYQENTSRFHFDIIVKSPLLIFPIGANRKTDRLVAHLGEIRANNNFVEASRRDLKNMPELTKIPVAQINCGLYDISFRSTAIRYDESGKKVEHSLPIIDDLDIVFNIENPENPKEYVGPGTQIEGNISDVRMALTERQYKSLLEAWGVIQKNFLAASSKTDDVNGSEATVVPENNGGALISSSQSQLSGATQKSVKSQMEQSDEVKINLDLIIKLKTVCLEVMVGEDTDIEDRDEHLLSRLAFNDICLKLQNMSDMSMLMEVGIQSISFADTRIESKSQFKEILPANTLDGPQFQVKYHTYNDETTPVMDIRVTVDSPKIVLSLDYLFLLKDFFMSPFVVIEPTEAQKFAETHGKNADKKQSNLKQLQQQNQAPATVMKFDINVVDLQVICLNAPESPASEAVILSFNQLTVKQERNLEVHLDGIGMILCRMDNREESTMHFVDDFSAVLKMETASTSSVHNLTSIKLNVESIILRLSYQDSMLIMGIVNKAMALMNTGDKNEAPKPSDDISELSSEMILLNDDSTAQLSPTSPDSRSDKPKGIEPFIVMSKETLSATFDGLQIVLIEDLHDLPFIDVQINPFTLNSKDWSRAIQADVDFVMKANNFNLKNSHWEPILEPWNFCIKVAQDATDKSTTVSLQSKDLMFVNITHAFLEFALLISGTLSSKKALSQTAQDHVKPYLIRNYTGYDLRFWNMSDDVEEGDTRVYKLENGNTTHWIFRDWKKRREGSNLGKNLFGVQIDENGWESIANVAVNKEGECSYRLRPEADSISHRLVVDIHMENHVKVVTFRSGLVLGNSSSQDLELAIVNKTRRMLTDVIRLKQGDLYYVPILLSYNCWVVVRPSDQYRWSTQMLMWSDFMLPSSPKFIECPPTEENEGILMSHKYQISPEFDKKNALVKQYPFITIKFCAPVEIENLLPFDFDLTLTNETTGERICTFVVKGDTAKIHEMKSSDTLVLQLDLKSDRYKGSDRATIKTTANYNSPGEKLVITDQNDVRTNLRMNISRATSTTDALHVAIYAPYLILNKTGLPISLRPRQSTLRQGSGPSESIPAYEEGEELVPTIFSYPDFDRHNRAQISINDSKWSDPISFEAVGSSQDVTLSSRSDVYARHAGIKVEEGTGVLSLTKLVTITPRFILKNNMNVPLKFTEFGTDEVTNIDPQQKTALYRTSRSHVRWLCLQLQELNDNWSSPFDIQEIGKTFVKLDKGDNGTPYLVRVSTHIKDSTIFVTFNEDDEWPFVIRNDSTIEISFKQDDIDIEDYDLKTIQKRALTKPRLFTLAPGETLKYSWDIPVAKEKRLDLLAGQRHRVINFQAIGAQVPFHYMKHREGPVGSNTLSIDIMADDSALVLRLTHFDLTKSLYRPKSSATSTLASTSREDSMREAFETVNVQHVTNYVLELNLAGVGLSVINRDVQEMAFATVRGFDFKYTDSNMYQSLRLSIQWLQIDDQLYGSTYPILCYPSTLPKVPAELTTHPTLHVALDKVKDDRHGVMYFKLFSILLQEMTFEIDEDFLYALLDFVQLDNAPQNYDNQDNMFIMTIAEPIVEKAEALYYFEEFCIQPMRLNLSFVRTERLENEESGTSSKGSDMGYIFNVFTMTLGNINDAPIKLNALIVENLRASSEDLTSRIILHYREQVIYQIHRVLGSIDILGNPVGLFNTLSSGFGELFYEPYQGFIMSDRPQDLGIGIAKGVGGFMKKGVFGITDSMSRFTGSLGKGISAATMDKKFQDRRRMNMTRNKPTHAIYGVTQGFGYFGSSIASGVAGLVKRPMEGAESGGMVGFMGGVGKGLVGAFTKPVVGFFDMASNVTAGIRDTTTVFEGGELARERLPRYIGRDGIVTTYSQREALGQMWLKEMESGKYFNESYIAHTTVNNDVIIAILSYNRLFIMRSDTLKTDYTFPLDTIQAVEAGTDKLYLQLKKDGTRVLSIEEKTSRIWFARVIERTLAERKEEQDRQ